MSSEKEAAFNAAMKELTERTFNGTFNESHSRSRFMFDAGYAAATKEREVCEWKWNDVTHRTETGCGVKTRLIPKRPDLPNGIVFCPFVGCGKPIKVKEE
jgi:hypothetical protein